MCLAVCLNQGKGQDFTEGDRQYQQTGPLIEDQSLLEVVTQVRMSVNMMMIYFLAYLCPYEYLRSIILLSALEMRIPLADLFPSIAFI